MWVEGGDIHDELLDQLGAVLTVPEDLALTPSAAELEALAAAVAVRWPGELSATAPGVAPVRRLQPGGAHPLRRIGSSSLRAGSVAAALVLFSASAAAAAGGVPLPRPVRAVAYTVGLPVDSPALDDTNHHIKDLKDAVKANDKPKAEATVRRLQTDLTKVPSEEKQEAKEKVETVLVQVSQWVAPTPTTATTSAPAPSSTTATSPASSTTATTAAAEEKDKDKDKEKGSASTTTTAPPTTTTTAPEETTTTTTTATGQNPSDGGGSPSGDPGTGDPGAGGAGTGGGDQGTTTPTTAPDGGTTTTTVPAGGTGGDPTTTTTTSSTTTTTAPPSDPGVASTQP